MLIACAACGSRAKEASEPRADLGGYAPAELRATPPEEGAPAPVVVRVRVYADTDYRAQEIDWEREIAERLERASAVLEPTCGVRLELERALHWERGGTDDLEAVLAELEIRDPGAEVDLVLGLVDSLPEPAAELERLGASRPLGRHVVLRNLAALAERDALVAAHPDWPEPLQGDIAAAHRQHKETVLLLREVGLLLSAPPEAEARALLHPRYSPEQSAFAPATAALLRAVVSPWGARDAEAAREAARAALAEAKPAWDEAGRAELFALMSRAPGQARGWELPAIGDGIRAADRSAYAEALELADRGSVEAAWSRLEPMVEFYPDDAAVAVLACRVEVARGSGRALDLCERAEKASGGHLQALFYRGQALRVAGKEAEGLAAFDRVAAALRELALDDDAAAWQALATAYRDARRVTDAEQAASAAGDDDTAAWARRTRARFALPAGGGVAPADEPAYVAAVEDALKTLYAGDLAGARARRVAMARRFSGAPGVAVIDCELAFRQRDYRRAEAECRRALQSYADASWPHYLLGLMARRAGQREEAARRLETALRLDPTLEHGYRALAELYRGRDAAALGRLETRYQEQFGKPLPAKAGD